jgi:hypothetical protein
MNNFILGTALNALAVGAGILILGTTKIIFDTIIILLG